MKSNKPTKKKARPRMFADILTDATYGIINDCHLDRPLIKGAARLRGAIVELSNTLVSVAEDRSYYEAIVDGSWPSATEIILRHHKNLKVVPKPPKGRRKR